MSLQYVSTLLDWCDEEGADLGIVFLHINTNTHKITYSNCGIILNEPFTFPEGHKC